MRIGIDIDGVILDFERQMSFYAEIYDLLVLKKDGVVNKKAFSYLRRYNWTKEETKDFVDKYLIKGTMDCNVIPGAKEVIDMLSLYNEIYIITARGGIKKETISYVKNKLFENKINVSNICFNIKDKLEIVKKLNIDVMIEDNPDTCKILSSNGIKSLYLRDKNSRVLEENEYLIEVDNWGEILRILINNIKDKKQMIDILGGNNYE